MHRRYRRAPRECVTAIAVLAGHALLILLWEHASRRSERPISADLRRPMQLRLLTPVPPRTLPERREPPTSNAISLQPLPSPPPPPMPAVESPPDDHSIRAVDWEREAQLSTRKTVDELTQPERRSFEPKQQPTAKSSPQFEWKPEPKTVGFSGLLPYVRLGKRCILGLGFFGCAIGELPKADGQLLEHMDDPDRPRSSVPDGVASPLP